MSCDVLLMCLCWRFSFVVGAAIYMRLQQQAKILSRLEGQCEVVGEQDYADNINDAAILEIEWGFCYAIS